MNNPQHYLESSLYKIYVYIHTYQQVSMLELISSKTRDIARSRINKLGLKRHNKIICGKNEPKTYLNLQKDISARDNKYNCRTSYL